jgi:hypothetical protein
MHKHVQFSFRNDKFRGATHHTNCKLWEHPHNGFVQTAQSRKMDGNFAVEGALAI